MEPGAIFSVLNSPSPGGEATLSALVAGVRDEKGGWTYELESVKASANGAAVYATPAPATHARIATI